MSRTKACKDCGQVIQFLRTTAGNWLPVDTYPRDGGNVMLQRGADGVVARVLGEAARLEHAGVQDLYWPHHATCPARQKPDAEPAATQEQLLLGGES